MSKEQFSLVEQKVFEMLQKGANQKVVPKQGQFLRNPFLVEKKDGGNRPMINFKNLNKFIPYENFSLEGLHCLKFLLEQDDFLCKSHIFHFLSTKTLKGLSDFNGQVTYTNFFTFVLGSGHLQKFLQNYQKSYFPS